VVDDNDLRIRHTILLSEIASRQLGDRDDALGCVDAPTGCEIEQSALAGRVCLRNVKKSEVVDCDDASWMHKWNDVCRHEEDRRSVLNYLG